MANLISVRLNRGDSHSWGFRLQGGKDFGTPLVIQKISGGSPAERAGLIAGDTVVRINNVDVYNLRHKDAQDVILRAGPSFDIAIHRGGSTWKPAVTPVGSLPSPRTPALVSNISPVTATSLTAGRQENIGAIGTTHNVSAKPFNVGQVNGGPRLVNKQYNSPLPLYSEQSIAETLSAQTEVLSNGVLGVNFKKNEKDYDSANSAVFRMVQEADKEPRDYEAEQETPGSGVITAPLGIAGLRHVTAPETKPQPPTPQLPPGQNICADCERLIVGVFVRIKDKNLHVECFKCSTCGTSLKNVGYYNLNNKLYCDVHAKLAARNNPPAPNLQPVTVPPGGKIPVGTISAALSSHSLSSPAPLSPNTNYSAAPYQPGGACFSSPRPFSSVNAPLSPPTTYPKLSPSSPTSALAESRGVQNIVWPPIPNEPEFPTASPLYFPPPSQVQVPRQLSVSDFELSEDQEFTELQEMDYTVEQGSRNMSMCSTEISNITGRRSTLECSETIADKIGAQILVESIMNTRVKSPQPTPKSPPPADVNVTFTISEAQLKQGSYANTLASSSICKTTQSTDSKACSMKETKQAQCMESCSLKETKQSQCLESKSCSLKETKQLQSLASMYEKKIKVENTVPHKWESPMLVALTVASDKPYSPSHSESIDLECREVIANDSFSQIPTKKSTSALASALATAPSEPFTPITSSSLEFIPLPEETVPYFPPEHHTVIESKSPIEPKNTDTANTPKYKRPKADDEFFKDLPKPPTERISMLSALTTAPDRSYSPLTVDTVSYNAETIGAEQSKVVASNTSLTQTDQKSKVTTNESSKSQSVLTDETQKSNSNQKSYSSFSKKAASCDKKTTNDKSKFVKCNAYDLVKKRYESKEEEEVDVNSSEKSSTSELVSKNIESTENITTQVSSGMAPLIQLVRSTFETKTDKVQMEMSCQFAGEPIVKRQITKKSSSKTDEEKTRQTSTLEEMGISHSSQKEIEETRSQAHTDLKSRSNSNKVAVTSFPTTYETNTTHLSESALLQKATSQAKETAHTKQTIAKSETCAKDYKATKAERTSFSMQQTTLQIPSKERITVIQPGEANLKVPKISFQPVHDHLHSHGGSFSPRPRSLTPSMINKPAPIIPSYQSSLVAVECAATEINLYDPTSPAVSRSPSPYPGRAESPFPSSSGRAVSPAPGPPPNPLQSEKSISQLINDGKMQQAKKKLQNFIPQHQNKLQSSLVKCESQKASDMSLQTVDVRSSSQQHNLAGISISQQHLHDMSNLQRESFEGSTNRSFNTQQNKTISEEYKSTQKCKMVESEKKVSRNVQFQSCATTSDSIRENQVVGFHVTNPQPIKSPFIPSKGSTNNTLETTGSNIAQETSQSDFNKKTIPPTSIPKLIKSSPINSGSVPTTTVSSNVNVKRPSISQPNTGSGGGRQAGAIGVAPKRGRGILNLAATPGSRVPLCGQCHSNIRGPFITALGKIWCPDHFICATPSCRRALHDLGFVEEHGQLYCEYCFEQYLAPPCSKCNSKVKGDCLKAIGKNFHPECFNCVYCGKLFGNSPFFLEDAQPYCEADWNELFTTKCFACGFPVEAGDRWVEALNNNYHSQCFNCTMCKKNLEGQSFFAKGGRPFCKNHAR